MYNTKCETEAERYHRLMEEAHVYRELNIVDTTYPTFTVNSACSKCRSHPSNGGSGVCHCTLGVQTVY